MPKPIVLEMLRHFRGVAVQRCRAGVSPVDVQCIMRVKNGGTLERYLQELAYFGLHRGALIWILQRSAQLLACTT